ncbi:hypothetical protein P4233_15365 [Pseudomonas aeruginosa]|nr:hypothetical protein [Pseudomonas aeruginosa]
MPPLKPPAYLQYKPDADWNNRLQATFFDSKDYPSRRRGKLRPAPGQHLHHGRPGQPVPHHPDDQLSLGIQNLFNRDYYPLYSQLLRNNNNTSHLPAPGTVLTASYTHNW